MNWPSWLGLHQRNHPIAFGSHPQTKIRATRVELNVWQAKNVAFRLWHISAFHYASFIQTIRLTFQSQVTKPIKRDPSKDSSVISTYVKSFHNPVFFDNFPFNWMPRTTWIDSACPQMYETLSHLLGLNHFLLFLSVKYKDVWKAHPASSSCTLVHCHWALRSRF